MQVRIRRQTDRLPNFLPNFLPASATSHQPSATYESPSLCNGTHLLGFVIFGRVRCSLAVAEARSPKASQRKCNSYGLQLAVFGRVCKCENRHPQNKTITKAREVSKKSRGPRPRYKHGVCASAPRASERRCAQRDGEAEEAEE